MSEAGLIHVHGSSKMRFGYPGVGNMGQPMAGKLLDAGHELWVHDVREDARTGRANGDLPKKALIDESKQAN